MCNACSVGYRGNTASFSNNRIKYFIHISYNGAAYHGWQRQKNAHTVQAELNSALQLLLGERVETLGCGRTDAGVHAHRFTAHFETLKRLNEQKFTPKLNKILPPDIACHSLQPVPDAANARFDAISRTYKYVVTPVKNPFLTDYACYVHHPLNVAAMNAAARLLLGTTDFTSFAKLHSDVKTNICTLYEARWAENKENNTLVFTITANRFLRNMVRAIVGTLLDVGRGKLSLEEFAKIVG
ncbi:MAG: tRNA pseudouridine(38-40) synthase TruA, partial [Prevotellaceae bacterium]|nr:tRNA pseudouridine(38-40) synthase TruA [Prevotellaceae bacterium]